MAKLPNELLDILKEPTTLKVVATLNEDGSAHVVFKGSLTAIDDETIAFNEGDDTYRSNKNLVRSIWFDKPVTVNVTKGVVSYQIKGKPYKCLITGSIFKQFLIRARERRGPNADIASVWLIKPEEIINESPSFRRAEIEAKKPFNNNHLDVESLINREEVFQ
jgi:hypothetical protein